MVCECEFVCSVVKCVYDGCVAVLLVQVHPSHSYLAVGEKGQQPVITIYTYPELRLHRVLRGEDLPGWRKHVILLDHPSPFFLLSLPSSSLASASSHL